jgi:CDP-diacylglycerol--glycerol-3-phosphate 3-phosphatidyltransferase/cardiolipin synthase
MTLSAAPALQLLDSRLEVSGGHKLSGELRVSGAKNSALVLMATCLLSRDTLRLRNVPPLTDITAMGEILAALGVRVTRQGDCIDLDGWLARKLNQTSAFGAFLDPVADKLMVAAALIILVQLNRVDAVIALIMIGREIAISALREWMAQLGESKSIAVSFLGKLKTATQMIAIPMLLYHDSLGPFDPQAVGTWLIYLAAALTLISMAYYLKAALPVLGKKE